MTPSLAWILGVMIPRLLPGAWGNIVPPITYEDRHRQINAYLNANPWGQFPEDTVLLEMGADSHRKRRWMQRAIFLVGR